MSTKLTAIKAKVPPKGKARLTVLNKLREVGKEIQEDFEGTVATWNHKPTFKIDISTAGGQPSVTVGTADEKYKWVDEGTSPHVIVPKKAKILRFPGKSVPKTRPGNLKAGAGMVGGDEVFAHVVLHPGTQPRKFSEKIKNKWKSEFGKRMLEVMKAIAKDMGGK